MRSLLRWPPILMAAFILSAPCYAAQAGIPPVRQNKLKAIAEQTRQKTEHARHQLLRARMELFEVYSRYDLDERRARAVLDRISRAQMNLLELHLEHQAELRRVLDEDEFASLWKMMSRKMGRPEAAVLPPPEEAVMDRLPDGEMIDRLELSPDQRRRLEPIVRPDPERLRLVDRLKHASRQIIELYSRYRLDTAAAKKLIGDMHRCQVELADLGHRKQQTLRTALNEAQFERLREEIVKRMHMHERKRPPKRF